MTEPDELDTDDAGTPYAVKVLEGLVYVCALSYASYAIVKHADTVELYSKIITNEARRRWSRWREWRRDRSRMQFEAFYITREAAPNA